jgi:molybdopterin-containing oxidoreductase family membrane subunit
LFDGLMFFGSFGVFMSLFLLFCRYLPTIAMSEVKGVMSASEHAEHLQAELLGGGHPHGHEHH